MYYHSFSLIYVLLESGICWEYIYTMRPAILDGPPPRQYKLECFKIARSACLDICPNSTLHRRNDAEQMTKICDPNSCFFDPETYLSEEYVWTLCEKVSTSAWVRFCYKIHNTFFFVWSIGTIGTQICIQTTPYFLPIPTTIRLRVLKTEQNHAWKLLVPGSWVPTTPTGPLWGCAKCGYESAVSELFFVFIIVFWWCEMMNKVIIDVFSSHMGWSQLVND